MNSMFMLSEWHVHRKRIAYSSRVNRPFVFGILFVVGNGLYFN